MNWNKGFSSRYYCTVVDKASWRDLHRYEVTGGNVSKTDTNLMESADVEMRQIPGDGETEVWIRVWLDARQEDDGAHEAVFTGLLSAPSVEWDGIRQQYRAECYSVLQPADDVMLPRGWYASAGMNGAKLAADLLSVGPAPVECADNAPQLSRTIIAEDSETNLSMALKIMKAIGWRIKISGRGVISVESKATETVIALDPLENDCVELSVTDTRDWFKCPNVYRATYNELTAIARDDNENSPLSTVTRGREVWMDEADCVLNDGESIGDYAARRLKEEQAPARTIKYIRRFNPEALPGELAQINYPAQHVEGVFRIRTQRIDLGYGARTQEEAVEA